IPSIAVGTTETVSFVVAVEAGLDPGVVSSIINTAEAKYTNANNTGDDTKTATHTMYTDCIPVDAGNITLSSNITDPICAGDPVELTAALSGVTGVDPQFVKWYTAADRTGAAGEGFSIIVNPTETTTYYVVVEGAGYCFNNPPAAITITVNPLPTTPTITNAGANEVCEGETIVLDAT